MNHEAREPETGTPYKLIQGKKVYATKEFIDQPNSFGRRYRWKYNSNEPLNTAAHTLWLTSQRSEKLMGVGRKLAKLHVGE